MPRLKKSLPQQVSHVQIISKTPPKPIIVKKENNTPSISPEAIAPRKNIHQEEQQLPTAKLRLRRPWGLREIDALKHGIARYEIGNWVAMAQDQSLLFHSRTPSDLKDKYRNLAKANYAKNVTNNIFKVGFKILAILDIQKNAHNELLSFIIMTNLYPKPLGWIQSQSQHPDWQALLQAYIQSPKNPVEKVNWAKTHSTECKPGYSQILVGDPSLPTQSSSSPQKPSQSSPMTLLPDRKQMTTPVKATSGPFTQDGHVLLSDTIGREHRPKPKDRAKIVTRHPVSPSPKPSLAPQDTNSQAPFQKRQKLIQREKDKPLRFKRPKLEFDVAAEEQPNPFLSPETKRRKQGSMMTKAETIATTTTATTESSAQSPIMGGSLDPHQLELAQKRERILQQIRESRKMARSDDHVPNMSQNTQCTVF